MADDDEIDILGDFENYLSKSSAYSSSFLVSHNTDILGCNYTIHPQWLLDKPSANPESWYDSSGEASGAEASESHNLAVEVDASIHSSITDESGWTKSEKNLLERGIEIFNKNEINLSQFIGSKTPSEVRYYLDNFYTGIKAVYNAYNGDILVSTDGDDVVSEVLTDVEIPASTEVIADDTDGSNANCSNGKDSSQDSDTSSQHQSTMTKQIFENINVKKPNTQIIPKKYTKLKLQTPMKALRNPKKTHQPMKQKVVKMRKDVKQKLDMNMTEITTGKGLSVPVCKGEEIVCDVLLVFSYKRFLNSEFDLLESNDFNAPNAKQNRCEQF